MKIKIAMLLNAVFVALASLFVSTNTYIFHQPKPPKELLK